MSKFVKLKDASGKSMAVNTDHVVYAKLDHQGQVILHLAASQHGGDGKDIHETVRLDMGLDEVLAQLNA